MCNILILIANCRLNFCKFMASCLMALKAFYNISSMRLMKMPDSGNDLTDSYFLCHLLLDGDNFGCMHLGGVITMREFIHRLPFFCF